MSGIGAGPMMLVESAPGLPEPLNVILSDSGGFVRVDWENAVVDPNVITRISSSDGCSLFLVRLSEPTISGIEFFISLENLLNGRCWRIRHENTVTGQVSNNVEIVEPLGGTVCDPPTLVERFNVSFCTGSPFTGTPHYVMRGTWVIPPGNTDPVFPEIEWFRDGFSEGVQLLAQDAISNEHEFAGVVSITSTYYRIRLRCDGAWSIRIVANDLSFFANPCTFAFLPPAPPP